MDLAGTGNKVIGEGGNDNGIDRQYAKRKEESLPDSVYIQKHFLSACK
jgi:hypothetical protein